MSDGHRITPREDVLRRWFEMPWAEQYEAWHIMAAYLLAPGRPEPKIKKRVEERAKALDCLRRAAKHLRRPETEAPTIEEYEQVRRELGELVLPLSRRQIETRWEGWSFAKLALSGERPVESSARRSLRRAHSARKWKYEDGLQGLRDWLASKPASATTKDYDGWARERNDANSGASSPVAPYVLAVGLQVKFVIPWEQMLRVANFEVKLADAQAARLEELTAASGQLRLITTSAVALIYGSSGNQARALVRAPGFPSPVAAISGVRAWYRDDVDAYKAGMPVPAREAGELQPRLVDSREAARRAGWTMPTLIGMVHDHGATMLQPAGRAGAKLFWMREEFEPWLAQRLARQRARLRKA